MKKSVVKSVVSKLAFNTAKSAAGSASHFGYHQRKEPEALKIVKK